VYKEA